MIMKKENYKYFLGTFWKLLILILFILVILNIIFLVKLKNDFININIEPIEHKTNKIEVGCCSYYNCLKGHKNMICEDGVEGDINNEYDGRIWYCGGETKICLYNT